MMKLTVFALADLVVQGINDNIVIENAIVLQYKTIAFLSKKVLLEIKFAYSIAEVYVYEKRIISCHKYYN